MPGPVRGALGRSRLPWERAAKRLASGEQSGGAADWAPSDLAALHTWWRADTVVTSGSNITQMTDKSGNGRHAVFASGREAELVSGIIGGQPVARFDGILDYAVAGVAGDWTFIHDGTGMGLVMVLIPRDTSGNPFFLDDRTGTNGNPGVSVLHITAGGNIRLSISNSGANILTAAASVSAGTAYALIGHYSESTTPEYSWETKGGAADTGSSTAAPTSADPPDAMHVGVRDGLVSYATYDLAECFFTTSPITGADRTSLDAYLSDRYGL